MYGEVTIVSDVFWFDGRFGRSGCLKSGVSRDAEHTGLGAYRARVDLVSSNVKREIAPGQEVNCIQSPSALNYM